MAKYKKVKKTTKTTARKKKVTRKRQSKDLLVFRDPEISSPRLRKAFWLISAIVGLLTLGLAIGSGINGDDSFQNAYADNLIPFYTSMGKDTSCFYHPRGPIQYYGAFYELLTAVSNQALSLDQFDPGYHQVRHFWNGLFGVAAMVFTGLVAALIAGWRAGILALIMLFLSPRFLGHALMNPKDIPFAAGYIIAIYFMMRFIRQLPKPSNQVLLGLGLGIGIGFGVRAGGLLTVFYFGMFVGLAFLLRYGLKGLTTESKTLGTYIGNALIPAIGGLILGLLTWPYALVDPFAHVAESLSELTNYAIGIRMLYAGKMMWGYELPFTYLPTWVLQTVPLFIPLGVIATLAVARGLLARYTPFFLFMLVFSFLFPFVYVIVQKSNLYDGWRHLIFPYTPLVALIAVGLHYLLDKVKENRTVFYGIVVALGLAATESALFIVRNSAFPYVYFNPMAGGVSGAFGNYETDYWGISIKEACQWLENEGIIHDQMTDTLVIASNFSYAPDRYLRDQYDGLVKVRYVRYRERYDQPWDYGLFLSRFVSGAHMQAGGWPPSGKTVHTIDANGVPLLAVLKGDPETFRAFATSNSTDAAQAVPLLEKEVEKDPANELAWSALATAYQSTGENAKAFDASERVLSIEPDNMLALNQKALSYLQNGENGLAQEIFQDAVEYEPRNVTAHYYLAVIAQSTGNLQAAIEHLETALSANPRFKPGYQLAAEISAKMGDQISARRYQQLANQL